MILNSRLRSLSSLLAAAFELTVNSLEGSKDKTRVFVNLHDGSPQINTVSIKLNTNPGTSIIKTITISNTGYGILKNTKIVQPTKDWIVVNNNLALGDILPKENRSFNAMIYLYNNINTCRYIDNIPEFPTIALPVISALGIMLLILRQKKENRSRSSR